MFPWGPGPHTPCGRLEGLPKGAGWYSEGLDSVRAVSFCFALYCSARREELPHDVQDGAIRGPPYALILS